MIRNIFLVIMRLSGITLIAATIFTFIAIVFFNPNDPTYFHANNNESANITGFFGATLADVCLQASGYAILYPLIFFAVVSLRLMHGNWPRYLVLRLAVVLLTLLSVCGTLNYIPLKIAGEISYGGYLGAYVIEEVEVVLAKLTAIYWLCGLSIIGILLSLGLTLKEWKGLSIVLYRFLITIFIVSKRSIIIAHAKICKTLAKFQSASAEDDIDDDAHWMSEDNGSVGIENEVAMTERKVKISQRISQDRQNISQKNINDIFTLPPLELLQNVPSHVKLKKMGRDVLERSVTDLKQVLSDFGINGKITNVSPGPVVTLYELEPAAGTKSSRVIGLSDDISRSMSAVSTRIAVIPGKNAIGIELPNAQREIVYLREVLEAKAYNDSKAILPLALGKNIGGEVVIADLARMPHLLVAGTTGSGKSVAINTMILSLLYRHTPSTCRLVMIDPKMLELSIYEGIPHLVAPVVVDPKKAVVALKWVIKEMEERYRSMSLLGVRNIDGYNKALQDAVTAGKKLTKQIQTGFDKTTGAPIFETIAMSEEPLPYIVVIVDEMADLMLVAGKDIEVLIQRLAQMARAAGIHLIMATQRPSVDVITGVIKANFPTRISFQVTSKIDSRTILGEQGAEQLLGMGDMLYMVPGGRIERVHGAFVADKEVEAMVNFLKEQSPPNYAADITAEEDDDQDSGINGFSTGGEDELYKQAIAIILKDKKVSTSYIQRCLRIGYNKAANLVERMEKEGIVSAPNHAGKRDILL